MAPDVRKDGQTYIPPPSAGDKNLVPSLIQDRSRFLELFWNRNNHLTAELQRLFKLHICDNFEMGNLSYFK